MGEIHQTARWGNGRGYWGWISLEPLIEKMECVLLQTTYKKNASNINFNLNIKFLKK